MPAAPVCPAPTLEQAPNVTPMIDVLLVMLIIFFLLNLPVPFIPLQVPPPPTPAGARAPTQIVLELPNEGGFRINGQPIPSAQLEQQLQAIYTTRPTKLLFVRAGGARSYREVITAVDRARGAGVEVIGLMPREVEPD